MEPQIPESEQTLIRNELLAGRKIQAIKIYREVTRKDLATAKREVEAMEAEMRATTPEAFQRPAASRTPSSGGGFLLKLIIFILAAVAGFYVASQRSKRAAPPANAPGSGAPSAPASAPAGSGAAVFPNDLSGEWVLKNRVRDFNVTLKLRPDGQYELTPKSLVYAALYRFDGRQLIMTKPTGGYSGFVWERLDADHLRLVNGQYAGSTLSRAGSEPLAYSQPTTQTSVQ
jgi:hypothetical protein